MCVSHNNNSNQDRPLIAIINLTYRVKKANCEITTSNQQEKKQKKRKSNINKKTIEEDN